MIVLGLSGVFGHDPAACLIRDGAIVAAAEEERFTRLKHGFAQVPLSAVLFCLHQAGVSLSDVDCIAASWNPNLAPGNTTLRDYLGWLFDRLGAFRGERLPPIEYVDHHIAHAASAFFGSGYPEAAIVVVDGQGEEASTSIGVGRNRTLRLETVGGIESSLGQFFRSTSEFVGFPGFSEGKFMGLAAYGRVVDTPDPFELTSEGYAPASDWPAWLATNFGQSNHARCRWEGERGRLSRDLQLPQWCSDLAATAQHHLERVLLHLIEIAIRRAGTRSVVLAGGVALNCSANGAAWRSGCADRIYIPPAPHDAGGAIGAAMWVASRHGQVRATASACLGPRFSSGMVADTLADLGLEFEEPSDIAASVADLIDREKIVGWFDGCMEFGPRALGSRSILASPRSPEMRERVNQLKGREQWRPLAPSMLACEARELIGDAGPFPFMLVASRASSEGSTQMPAAVHVDGTVRAQTVSGPGRFAELLRAVKARTDRGVVLNTSFNLDFEPIVCTPQDAVRTFFSSSLDALAIEGLLLIKRSSPRRAVHAERPRRSRVDVE